MRGHLIALAVLLALTGPAGAKVTKTTKRRPRPVAVAVQAPTTVPVCAVTLTLTDPTRISQVWNDAAIAVLGRTDPREVDRFAAEFNGLVQAQAVEQRACHVWYAPDLQAQATRLVAEWNQGEAGAYSAMKVFEAYKQLMTGGSTAAPTTTRYVSSGSCVLDLNAAAQRTLGRNANATEIARYC